MLGLHIEPLRSEPRSPEDQGLVIIPEHPGAIPHQSGGEGLALVEGQVIGGEAVPERVVRHLRGDEPRCRPGDLRRAPHNGPESA